MVILLAAVMRRTGAFANNVCRCLCMLLLIPAVTWPSHACALQSNAPRSAAEPAVAHRLADLTRRLSRQRLEIQGFSMSPDGNWLAYREDTTAAQNRGARLILLNTVSGRRRQLELPSDAEPYFRRLGDPEFRWSDDSRELAILAQVRGNMTLVRWSNSASTVRSIRLGAAADQQELSRFRAWEWNWPGGDRAVLAVVVRPATSPSVLARANELTGPRWRLSEFRQARDLAHRAALNEDRLPVRLAQLGPDGLRFVDPDRPLTIAPLNGSAISAQAGNSFMVRAPDSEIVSTAGWTLGYQEWLFENRDPRTQAYSHARTALAILNANGAVQLCTRVGPGLPYDAVVQAGGRVAFLQADPDLGVWPAQPTHFGYARLRVQTCQSDNARTISTRPILNWSTLAPGPTADSLWLREPLAVEQQISSIDLQTGTIRRVSPEGYSATAMATSADGRTVAAVFENANLAPEIFVRRTPNSAWRKLTANHRRIHQTPVRPVETVRWRSGDNRFSLTGFLITPAGPRPPSGFPTVVMLHGGPGATVMNEYNYDYSGDYMPTPQILAAAGYAVFIPNFRGDRGFGREFSLAIRGGMRETYDRDIRAGIDLLIESGLADPARLGLYGHSAGSAQLAYALTHDQRFRAAVNHDGAVLSPLLLSAWKVGDTAYPAELSFAMFEAYRTLIGNDAQIAEWVDFRRIRTPLLMRWSGGARAEAGVYGSSWGEGRYLNTPLTQMLDLSLSQNDVPFEVIIDRDRHVITEEDNLVAWESEVVQWFERYLRN